MKRLTRVRVCLMITGLLAACALVAYALMLPARVEAIGGNPSQTVVISQVYGGAGCGTAGCSTYQNDYIELFNRSKTAVTMTGWSVQYAAATGTSWQVTNIPTVTLQPGQYYLIAESFSANGVNPLPTPDATGSGAGIAMSATAAKVALVNGTTALTVACPSNTTGANAIIDFVGYGATANCSETANAPAPSTTTSDTRNGGGNVDTDNNSTDFQALTPNPHNTASTAGTPTASASAISGQITTETGAPVAGVTMMLSGSQAGRAITDDNGFYRFAGLDSGGFYSVAPARANYSFSPSSRSFSLVADKTDAAFTATPATTETANPLDTSEYFVRQQYLDFLDREPDQAGFEYWTAQLDKCAGDAGCLHQRRVDVSRAFFAEAEYQQTGSFIYRLYKASYGERPSYAEFKTDRSRVIGGSNLEASKAGFADEFVTRDSFQRAYPSSLSNAEFVKRLYERAGLDTTSAELEQQAAAMNAGKTRALVLRDVIETQQFRQKEYNASFVLTEYFGYLRRDPDPDGLSFWLNVLDNKDANNYRGMVCSFVTSAEYQQRFSRVTTRSNRDCR